MGLTLPTKYLSWGGVGVGGRGLHNQGTSFFSPFFCLDCLLPTRLFQLLLPLDFLAGDGDRTENENYYIVLGHIAPEP